MKNRMLRCGHCGIGNAVAACGSCGRYFVVTQAHLDGQPRTFESKAVSELPDSEFDVCDFCAAGKANSNPIEVAKAGLSQQTCPNCHTEFLSGHGLWQGRACP